MVDTAPASCGRVPVPMYTETMKFLKLLRQGVDTRTTGGPGAEGDRLAPHARRVTEAPATPHWRHPEARLTPQRGEP
jgi:hypothetical protein